MTRIRQDRWPPTHVLGIMMLGVVVGGAVGFRTAGIAGAVTGLVAGSFFTVSFAVATNQRNPTSSRLAGAVGLVVIPIAAYVGGWTLGWAYVIGAMTVLFILAMFGDDSQFGHLRPDGKGS